MSAEYSQLSPSELLTMYMDGELPEAMHQPLFAMLAEQSELQQEMNDHLTVRRHMDTTLIAPPRELQESVMRRIGAIAVGASLNTPAPISMMQSIGTFIGNAFQPIAYMLLGAAISGLLFMNQSKEQSKNPEVQNFMNPDSKAESPMLMMQQSTSKGITQQRKNQQTSFFDNHFAFDEQVQPAIAQSIATIPLELPLPTISLSDMQWNDSELQRLESYPQTAEIINPINEEKLHGISGMIRGFTAHSFTPQIVNPSISPSMNNMALSVTYSFNNSDAIFIEAGQEFLPQRFTGIESNYTVQYDQTFLAGWATLGWQHTFSTENPLRPIIRLGIGATETGPMTRAMAGIEYDITKRLSLIAGIEGMSTVFTHQQQWFSTQKLGLSCGAKIAL